MPSNGTARGVSLLSAIGLLFTAIVLCYLNTTTSHAIGSTIYIAALVATTLAMATKLAAAVGVENKFSVAADYVASLVPWIAVYFNLIQFLHYTHDGLDGFMAGIALIALIFVGAFGLLDSIGTFIGKKYKDLSEAAHEASSRVSAASQALGGNPTGNRR